MLRERNVLHPVCLLPSVQEVLDAWDHRAFAAGGFSIGLHFWNCLNYSMFLSLTCVLCANAVGGRWTRFAFVGDCIAWMQLFNWPVYRWGAWVTVGAVCVMLC